MARCFGELTVTFPFAAARAEYDVVSFGDVKTYKLLSLTRNICGATCALSFVHRANFTFRGASSREQFLYDNSLCC